MRQLRIGKTVTNREDLSLIKYLHEIGKVDLVTSNEETELALRVKQGDEGALERLIRSNLRFVVSCAKQYQNQGLSLPDLINEGNLGLIKAAQRFDPTRGFKFISYAVWWIRQSILQGLAEKGRMVRLPLNKIGSITRINKVAIRLEQDYLREPTPREVAVVLKTSADSVEDALQVSLHHISMDSPIYMGEGGSMYDQLISEESLSPDNKLIRDSLCAEVERTLLTLTEREVSVVRYFFGLGGCRQCSLNEISNKLGLSEERVRQIKDKSLKKLRNNYRSRLLKQYL
jgi:RNA polymerase primary sigma factor